MEGFGGGGGGRVEGFEGGLGRGEKGGSLYSTSRSLRIIRIHKRATFIQRCLVPKFNKIKDMMGKRNTQNMYWAKSDISVVL